MIETFEASRVNFYAKYRHFTVIETALVFHIRGVKEYARRLVSSSLPSTHLRVSAPNYKAKKGILVRMHRRHKAMRVSARRQIEIGNLAASKTGSVRRTGRKVESQ